MKAHPVSESQNMTRQAFLKRMLGAGALMGGSALLGTRLWDRSVRVPGFEKTPGITLPGFQVDPSPVLPELVMAHGTDHGATISAAVDGLGGMRRFVKPGEAVLIKPNVAFDRPAALGTTTHPEALRAVAHLVWEAGASRILIADNPINSPQGCFLKSGLTAVASEMNLDIIYPEEHTFTHLSMEGDVLREWPMFYAPFHKADKVIGLAPCKDHNLCSASMTMKNWYGMLGGRRNQFHQHIHRIISDFALMVKPTLVILDGMRILQSNGPTGGRLSDVKERNTVIAGTDMVSVDACGYEQLLGRDLAQLTYVHLAQTRGLGRADWRNSRVKEVNA
jgi:uncharacterized protein (DUF362 family)